MTGNKSAPRGLLERWFQAALKAVDPAVCVPPALPEPPPGRTVVVGAGKAAARMAAAVERHWPGPLSGVVVTAYGHGEPCRTIGVREAGHPVPDAAGVAATREILAAVDTAGPDDLVLVLLSGGGSSLLVSPVPGVTLEDKQALHRALLRSGAAISEINTVRRCLSQVKGGGLARRAAPARVVTLVLSDVPGDDPSVVASGPTAVVSSAAEDAAAILQRYRIPLPDYPLKPLHGNDSEGYSASTPAVEHRIVATAWDALEAAARAAREDGVEPLILGDALEGEAREVGRALAGIALSCRRHGAPARTPCVLLSGGETTVTVRGRGHGGRNSELALAMGVALRGCEGIYVLAADTDGIDGDGPHAGAFMGPEIWRAGVAAGLDGTARLADNDSRGYFEAVDGLLVTGPTRTNVNDFRAVWVVSGC